MIRVSAYYRGPAGARFDFDYYRTRHLPMVMECLRAFGALRCEVERGLEMSDGAPPDHLAVGTLYFESMAALREGLAQHGAEIFADVPNYTELAPRIQFGEIA
jgi:uncharacterized protein (TIGR02118 family)